MVISETPFTKRENEKYEFGITVDPNDVESITTALVYLKNNPEEAQKMGQRGRMLIENIYNWEAEEKKLFDLYNVILNI